MQRRRRTLIRTDDESPSNISKAHCTLLVGLTLSNGNFKPLDSNLAIRFNEQTAFPEIAESANPIPLELFRFRS
ncbi:hypothetical protein Bca52824_027643 [Brassica carinata]|uniref:Uncharacterized protein n=1 Tax=Brassica carinata TaxID=52824 RepID=A0A8X7VAU4_BRACI|nr:hypothetical protein Bca52824_027643 [Brassica carinata]